MTTATATSEGTALLAGLRFSACRFCLKRSRIEPEEGETPRAAGSSPPHGGGLSAAGTGADGRPAPLHLAPSGGRPGGWAAPATAWRFGRFVAVAAAALAPDLGWGRTVEEPNVGAAMGCLRGVRPPGERNPARHRQVQEFW